MKIVIGNTKLALIKGDITEQDTEAIVNAANSGLLGGGGVDGAIHRAGGPLILEQCKQIRAKHGKCATGKAVITHGGNLPAKYVIHAVGPVWTGGLKNEDQLLRSAYICSLQTAQERGIRSISFPSISTGAYRFPIERASRIALRSIIRYLLKHPFEEIRIVLFDQRDLQIYQKAWKEIEIEMKKEPSML